MKPGASTLSDSRDSLKSTKITRKRKQEVMVPENGTCQSQDPDTVKGTGACWGPGASQTVVLSKGASRTQLYQKSSDSFQL